MADFGTILNSDNTTLSLYCKSINTLDPISYFNAYFNANFLPFYILPNTLYIVLYETQFNRFITGGSPRITITKDGIYNISLLVQFVNRGGNDVNNISLSYSVYSGNTALYTSFCPAVAKMDTTFDYSFLSFSQIQNLEEGQSIQITVNNTSEGVSLEGVDLTLGNISVNYICPF